MTPSYARTLRRKLLADRRDSPPLILSMGVRLLCLKGIALRKNRVRIAGDDPAAQKRQVLWRKLRLRVPAKPLRNCLLIASSFLAVPTTMNSMG